MVDFFLSCCNHLHDLGLLKKDSTADLMTGDLVGLPPISDRSLRRIPAAAVTDETNCMIDVNQFALFVSH